MPLLAIFQCNGTGPCCLVAVAFSLLWLTRVMLHLLHQGRMVQSKCTVGSWYQSSMDHCPPLWSCSHHPINPKTSISTVSPQSRGLRFTIQYMFHVIVFTGSEIYSFSPPKEKNIFTSSISASSDSFPSKFLSVPRPFLRLSFIQNRNETKLET